MHFAEAPILGAGALTGELRAALAAGAEVAVWRSDFRDLTRLGAERREPVVHVSTTAAWRSASATRAPSSSWRARAAKTRRWSWSAGPTSRRPTRSATTSSASSSPRSARSPTGCARSSPASRSTRPTARRHCATRRRTSTWPAADRDLRPRPVPAGPRRARARAGAGAALLRRRRQVLEAAQRRLRPDLACPRGHLGGGAADRLRGRGAARLSNNAEVLVRPGGTPSSATSRWTTSRSTSARDRRRARRRGGADRRPWPRSGSALKRSRSASPRSTTRSPQG